MSNKALILGVSGQDGAYLAKHLLAEGYEVVGASRDADNNPFSGLHKLGIFESVELESVSTLDFRSVAQVLQKHRPDELYNLSGQSSVGLSFAQPADTIESHLQATINILEVIKFLDIPIRFYNACSSECFGDIDAKSPANEQSPFKPRSPYAVGKAAAFWAVANYREAYGLFACSGVLGNHESPLRPQRFVTQKIIQSAKNISMGKQAKLELGNTDIIRDWGLSSEYVDAMHRMLQLSEPEDFVIATGSSYSLWDFVETVFGKFDLNAGEYVSSNESFLRPLDIRGSYLDPSKALELLDWKAHKAMPEVVDELITQP